MGLQQRLFTAVVALPLGLWCVWYSAGSFLALVLVLQTVCISELNNLLALTSPAYTITNDGGQASNPLFSQLIAAMVCVASAWGHDLAGLAIMAGIAGLIARRLKLMQRHQLSLLVRCEPVAGEKRAGNPGNVVDVGLIVLALEVVGILYVVGGWSSLVVLRFRSESNGISDTLFLIAVVFNSDNGGLFVGSIARKWRSRRVRNHTSTSPEFASTSNALTVVSPNKTWAGVAGSISLGMATAVVCPPLLDILSGGNNIMGSAEDEGLIVGGWDSGVSISWLQPVALAAVGFLLSMIGILGDLGESLLKRAARVKDSGTLFPGHGGCLDRFDGVLMAAPFFYFLVQYFSFTGSCMSGSGGVWRGAC